MAKQTRHHREYTFVIDAFSPETIPMVRLAEYMADLATLLGEYKSVHFVRLGPGSTQLVHAVEYEAEPKVRERIHGVRNNEGPIEAMRAARDIDKRLAQDNASGLIKEPTGTKILEFPGKKRFTSPEYGPFNQPGVLDGIPIRVGGETDPVPVHLEEPGQEAHICYAARVIASQIAPYIFSTMLRAEGVGRYHRDPDGKWIRDRFTIHSFKKLRDIPLSESIGRLRAIKSNLHNVADPLKELEIIRHGKSNLS
ncbi:MAG TPA: hypothetical protein VG096_20035 [Bryobacteraceae bacterium]|jgi:hypothetical protein|nr:hypothetical protein [Bryobacteraceae bacterium]